MDDRERIDDPEEATRAAQDAMQARIWTTMPGKVLSFDATKQTASIQPLIQGRVTAEDGTQSYVNLPVLVDVPVFFYQAGGMIFTVPITAGDEVLVHFAARCIDGWWYQGGVQPPLEGRMHDLSDAFAMPGIRSLVRAALVIGGVNTTDGELRNLAGTAKVAITAAGAVNILSAVSCNVTAPLVSLGKGVKVKNDADAEIVVATHTHQVVCPAGGGTVTSGVPQ